MNKFLVHKFCNIAPKERLEPRDQFTFNESTASIHLIETQDQQPTRQSRQQTHTHHVRCKHIEGVMMISTGQTIMHAINMPLGHSNVCSSAKRSASCILLNRGCSRYFNIHPFLKTFFFLVDSQSAKEALFYLPTSMIQISVYTTPKQQNMQEL